ncbi:hypothetical protein BH10CHL1_BH10CHL1_30710 [soil metagenome]
MPISTSSFGDERDNQYSKYERSDQYDQETMDCLGLSPEKTEALLKKLGGGVVEKYKILEGIGWKATIIPVDNGVQVEFNAHDELLEDLLRRFGEMVEKAQA